MSLTPDLLDYLRRKRQDMYDIRAKLKHYRIKRSRHFSWELDEVERKLAFYDDWTLAEEYDSMSPVLRQCRILGDKCNAEIAERMEQIFFSKPSDVDQTWGLAHYITQETKQ